jgi:hypothetical protein
VAGMLILLISLTLIVLKLGFLLLLVAGPFFLIIGTHPGFGRIIAVRWFEMLVGVLMKQVAISIVLSVLLYSYSLIMGTSDAALPWALKILMIALVTMAVFIYRKPFTHLFSAVGYGTLGASERAEYSLREASTTFRRSTLGAASVAIPGVAGYRAARWARRNPGQAAALAVGAAGAAGAGAAAGAVASGDVAGTAQGAGDAYASRLRQDAPPAADGEGGPSPRRLAGVATSARGRAVAEGDGGATRTAPPLDLPPRSASGGNGSSSAASGWSRGAGRPAGGPAGSPGTRARAVSTGSPRSAPPAPASGGTAGSTRSGPPGPGWPSAGWTGASARQRAPVRGTTGSAGSRPRPSAPPADPPASGQGAGGRGTEESAPMPFWLRPVRRDK